MMNILRIRTFEGPNVHSHRPLLAMTIDLDEHTGRESHCIAGFNERLSTLLPGLARHRCSRRRAGGFLERLAEGTYFGHVIEHAALELSDLAGIPVYFGKTLYDGVPGRYTVITEYRSEQGMQYLLRSAFDLVAALIREQTFPLEEVIGKAKEIVDRFTLGPSTKAIVDAAERRGFPWRVFNDSSVVQIGYGKNRRLVEAAAAETTSAVGMDIASDKELTKVLLAQAAIPVPQGKVVHTEEEALEAFAEMGCAVTVKPLDGRQGKGVSLDLTTAAGVAAAFRAAKRHADAVIVEEFFAGADYRVLVINGTVAAASKRVPPHVIGDGERTIAELVERTNTDPRRGEGHGKPMTRIVIDDIVLAVLQKNGLGPQSVPAQGQVVCLRENGNLSTGGVAEDVTDLVHPAVVLACERAARSVGLNICGVDLVVPDIGKPINSPGNRGGIVEVNAMPGLRMHVHPGKGQPRPVGDAIMEMLYPGKATARIPIISITGTNGKTTVTRMIAHILQDAGKHVGMTTTDGISINGRCIAEGDMTGPRSCRTVLADPAVEVAVLETARGGIVRSGLGYDWSDIGIITNIQEDHIGHDGIESVEDIIHIKSLVAERVREGGTLILNADDANAMSVLERKRVREVEKRIVLYALSGENPLLMRHRAAGGTVFFLRRGAVVEAAGDREIIIVNAEKIPATMQGLAVFNMSNAMAAVAACRAAGYSPEVIARSIGRFSSNEHNQGRVNLFAVNGSYVMVDYGHNPHAVGMVARAVSTLLEKHKITGVLGAPGDRADSILEEVGRVAAQGFGRIIIREDFDLRGRAPGEAAQILLRGIRSGNPVCDCNIVLNECEAMTEAIQRMGNGELVIVFYDELDKVMDALKPFQPKPVHCFSGKDMANLKMGENRAAV